MKYGSDKDMPSVFWITNGWNDFQGNMAAGAGLCGTCYWQVPASISGHSRHQKWDSYAAEQRCPEDKTIGLQSRSFGNFALGPVRLRSRTSMAIIVPRR